MSETVSLDLSDQFLPSPRASHSSAVVGDKLFIFGGITVEQSDDPLPNVRSYRAPQTMYLDDLVVFNFVKKMWEPMAAKSMPESGSKEHPSQRAGHSMIAVGDNIYLFGGRFGGIIYNDLYLYNTSKICSSNQEIHSINNIIISLDSNQWSRVNATGDIPSERVGCSLDMAGRSDNPFLVLWGGTNGKFVFDQLYLFNIPEKKWYLVNSTQNTPESRYFHATAKVGEILYLFGGGSGNAAGLLKEPLLDIHLLNLRKNMFFLLRDDLINFAYYRSTV